MWRSSKIVFRCKLTILIGLKPKLKRYILKISQVNTCQLCFYKSKYNLTKLIFFAIIRYNVQDDGNMAIICKKSTHLSSKTDIKLMKFSKLYISEI